MTHLRLPIALILPLLVPLAAPALAESDGPSGGVPFNVEWPADAAGHRRRSSEHTLVRVAVEPASAFAEVGKPLAVKILACNHTSLPLAVSPRELARHVEIADVAGRRVEPTGRPVLPPPAADHELSTDKSFEVSLNLSHLTIARPGLYRVQYRRPLEAGKHHVSWEGVVWVEDRRALRALLDERWPDDPKAVAAAEDLIATLPAFYAPIRWPNRFPDAGRMLTADHRSFCGNDEIRIEYLCPPGSRPADVHWQREEWYEAMERAFIYHRQRRDNAGAANLLFAIAGRARELSGDFALRPEQGFADALLKFARRLGPDVHAALADHLFSGIAYWPMRSEIDTVRERRHQRHVPFLVRAATHARKEWDSPAAMSLYACVVHGEPPADDPYALVRSVIRCYLGDAAAWPSVRAALADPDPLLRRGAALAMADGRLAGRRDEIVPLLRAALAAERDPSVLNALIGSLSAYPSPEGARLIRPFEQSGATRVAAAIALMRIDAAMLRAKVDAPAAPR